MHDIKESNPSVTERQSNNKIVSTTSMHDKFSLINIKFDSINYCIWFKILKIYITQKKNSLKKDDLTFNKWENEDVFVKS